MGHDLTPQGNIEFPIDQTLRIVSTQRTSSGVQIGCSTLPYHNYVLLHKETVSAPMWTSIATNRSTGTLTYFNETNATRLTQPQGFYRVTQLP